MANENNLASQIKNAFPPVSEKPAASSGANDRVASFARNMAPIAERVSAETGVDPAFLIGQWGLETGWGKSVIPGTNNFGNIKDFRGSGVTARDNMNGSVDKYRAYESPEDFAGHFAQLLKTGRYKGALGALDAQSYFSALKAGGYAEDPNYVRSGVKAADMVKRVMGEGRPAASIYPERGEYIGQTEKVLADSKRRDDLANEGFGSAFSKGFGDATDQIPELAVGAGAAVADVLGFDGLRDAGLAYVKKSQEESQKDARSYSSFTDSLENGDLGRWVGYALGYGSNQLAQAALTGGLGAAIGKVGLSGLLKGTAERVTAEAIAKGATQEVAAKAGMEAAQLAAQKYGAGVAMYANTYGQELGSIYPDAVSQSDKTGNPLDLARVFGSAGVAAALEAAPEIGIAGKLIDGVGKGSARMVGRAAVTIPKQMALEGGTEYAQTGVEQWGAQRPLDTPEAEKERMDSAAMGAVMGGPAGVIESIPSPRNAATVQPVIKQNSPLSNMASVGQAAQANAEQASAQVAPEQAGAAAPGANTPAQDPTADRLAAMQSFVEDKAFIQALRGTEGYGPESVTELLSAYAKARNPNIDPRLRERALSDMEKFVETFNNRPNFVFGKNTQEPTPQPGQSVAPYQQQGGAVGPAIRRPDGRTIDGEIITRPEGMAGANPNQLKAPPVLGLPTEEALQAKRQADADYEQAYQDLVKAEQLGANEAEIADYQRTLLEAERLRDELAAQIADSDARVADSQQREAEARRRDILGSVIEQGISGVNPVADVAGRFSAELMRQGYRDTAPTDAETQSILRAVDVANAREDGPLPSLPNEGDFYAPPKAQRTAPPKAEPKPKQQPNRRLTPKEIREYVAAGAILNGDTLTLPDGTVLKLKGPQIAAAREAMRKVAPAQVESAPAQPSESGALPQPDAPQQVESPAAVSEKPAETYDVSTRTDDQLRYLANNGKPGWKEAAQAKMARREGAKPEIRSDLDAAAHEAATSPLNDTPQPTDGQKSAGNYKMGRVRVQGMDISIENPKGSVRSGTSPDGRKWESTLHAHYGYFTGTKAADGDHLDVYLTDGAEDAPMVWVIDQKNADGTFDEHKTLLGPRTEEEAKAAYLANYEPGWDGIGAISSMPIEAFKAWAFDGKKKRKPLVYVEPDGGALKTDEVARIIHESIAENAIKNSVKYNEEGVSKGRVSREVADASMERTRQDWAKFPINDRTVRLAKAVVDKEPRILVGAWAKEGQGTYGNEGSMNAFEKITGVKLRRLNSAQRAKAIFDWAGWSEEQVAEDVSRRRAEQEELKAQRQEKDDKATADQAERAQIKIRETGEVKTVREYIDGLIADGYTEIRTAKRGAVTKTVLANAEGWGRYLSSGIVKEYAVVASRRALDAKASGQSNPDTTTGDEEAEAPATAQPDPRESYADEKERAYVAKRGGVVPPKAAMAVRIGAYREYDRNQAAQPTHQDPGQPSEPVTPTVVAKSIQKSARNTEFNPAEAKKWLIGEIDKAVANVPAENAELGAELARYKSAAYEKETTRQFGVKEFKARRNSNIDRLSKQIGFVTFDVPGDGKFKVMNTVDGLNNFRSKVEKSPGFARPTAPRVGRSMPGGPSLDESIADAKKNGGSVLSELGNAIEIARLRGKEDDTLLGRFKENSGGKSYDDWRAEQEAAEEIAAREEADRNRQPSDEDSAEFMRNLLELHGESNKKYKFTRDTIASAYGEASRFLYGKSYTPATYTRHKAQIEARLVGAGLSKSQASQVVVGASSIRAGETRGSGPMQFIQSKYVIRSASDMGLIAPVDLDGRTIPAKHEKTEANPKPILAPNPLDFTPKQYHEARMKWVAQEYGLSDAEVRQDYDTPAARDADNQAWVDAVRQAFKDGTELTRATLDKLEELRPGAFLSNLHDYPDANVPDGYQTPSARKAEKEAADAKHETRSEVAQPSDLTNIFAGLSSRGLAKTRAQKAAQAHPRAEQIAYVQDNFLDILTELEDSGIVKINCD